LERVGDVHGMARTWGNLGYLFEAQGDTDQAAHYAARAYLVFVQLGAERDAAQAASQLAEILGSVDAANAYLAELEVEV
jgi:hypothetical protein